MFKIDPRFRLAAVERYDVNTVLFSSILQFGDAFSINAESNALALQEEGNILAVPSRDVFEIYPLYKVIPKHLPYVPNVKLNRVNLNPTIQVGSINYNGISSASASVIGSVHSATMLARVHQIRHFLSPPTIHYQTPGISHAQPTFSQLMQPLVTGSMQPTQSDVLVQPTVPVSPVVTAHTVVPVAPVVPVHTVVPTVPSVPVVPARKKEPKLTD
ncbi:spore germination protein GerPE [Gottfriedia acidiceleris]|uniref:spore germination protein GerPE n=1 Tax=Gottfriedia acidiceleris TaxID=371036 RepID=UPI00101C18CA|nr:spore germination protein GerPE [Gottfriedia acidiceleris]